MYQSCKLSMKTPCAGLQSAGNEQLGAEVDFLHFSAFSMVKIWLQEGIAVIIKQSIWVNSLMLEP